MEYVFFDVAKIRKILPKKLEKLFIFFLPLWCRAEISFPARDRGRRGSLGEACN